MVCIFVFSFMYVYSGIFYFWEYIEYTILVYLMYIFPLNVAAVIICDLLTFLSTAPLLRL